MPFPRWQHPEKGSDGDKYLHRLASVWGDGWTHDDAGYSMCRLCFTEAGSAHDKGCPVDALGKAIPDRYWRKDG